MLSYQERLPTSDVGGGGHRSTEGEGLSPGVEAGSSGPSMVVCLGAWLLAPLGGLPWCLPGPRAH